MIQTINLIQFLPVYKCVCVQVYVVLLHVLICVTTTIVKQRTVPLQIPLVTHIPLLLSPFSPNSCKPFICSPSLSFCYLKNVYKWNHRVHRILQLTNFSLNIILVLRTIQVVTCTNSSFLFHGTRTTDPLIRKEKKKKKKKKNTSMHIAVIISQQLSSILSLHSFLKPFLSFLIVSLQNLPLLRLSMTSMLLNDHFQGFILPNL